MSRKNPQEYVILGQNKFNEYCFILGVKELSCYDPEKKTIEKAFRRQALKTHPDKGGDPVEFKKINDAYNRLIGHICKLEQQAEENELADSVLIEVSKTSVQKWIEKMKRAYGYPKSADCKCIIFEGPYKQFKGKSKMTGPVTVVLYEDPPDNIPKIHIRSKKYMAWIAEQMLQVHMHVEKGRSIQFDQWRIRHVAEFGISAFKTPTPAPERKQPEPKAEKPKRKARDSSIPKPKTRRDSEPVAETDTVKTNGEAPKTDKENLEPTVQHLSSSHLGSDALGKDVNTDGLEQVSKDISDSFPKLFNMGNPSLSKIEKMCEKLPEKETCLEKKLESFFQCSNCKTEFTSIKEYSNHKVMCQPKKNNVTNHDNIHSEGDLKINPEKEKTDKNPKVTSNSEETVQIDKTNSQTQESNTFKQENNAEISSMKDARQMATSEISKSSTMSSKDTLENCTVSHSNCRVNDPSILLDKSKIEVNGHKEEWRNVGDKNTIQMESLQQNLPSSSSKVSVGTN